MIYIITYADEKYKLTQNYNEYTAYKYGADVVYKFGSNDIESDFIEKNQEIFSLTRGSGCWLWKPYFINKVLEESDEGDWIVYTDSSLYFNRNIQKYIERYVQQKRYFVVRGTKFLEKQYTKADVLSALGCEDEQYCNTRQLAATVIIMKNCVESKELVAEWLRFSQDRKLISDDIIKPNVDGFLENRHDQSILSLLCKKRGILADNNLFRDIVLPFHRRALLTYHHTKYGCRYQMFAASIIRVLKYIF